MKRFFGVLLCVLALGVAAGRAQVRESADVRQFTISAGAMASGFESGLKSYESDSNTPLIGVGTYVDLHFTHWIQLEGEGRWLRWNQYDTEKETNYLIGPRVPIRQFGRAQVFGKALIGQGKMNYPYSFGHGKFTAIAFGGSVDYKLSRKLTLRALDFEYQDWPKWKEPINLKDKQLKPYGLSMGMAYRVY